MGQDVMADRCRWCLRASCDCATNHVRAFDWRRDDVDVLLDEVNDASEDASEDGLEAARAAENARHPPYPVYLPPRTEQSP